MTTPDPSLREQLDAAGIACYLADGEWHWRYNGEATDRALSVVATWLRSDEVHTLMLAHLKTSIEGCHCGWAELGQSHPRHVATVLADSMEGR